MAMAERQADKAQEFILNNLLFFSRLDAQPSQTCSGGFIKTQLYAICCYFFAIGEYNLI